MTNDKSGLEAYGNHVSQIASDLRAPDGLLAALHELVEGGKRAEEAGLKLKAACEDAASS